MRWMQPLYAGLLRRHVLLGALTLGSNAQALPAKRLVFPRDFGAHPDFQTEWWYITGHAVADGRELGFQVTFFRSRVAATQSMTSRFAAKQLIFAHAAVTDVKRMKLFHDQRIARLSEARFTPASASETDTDLQLGHWSLQRSSDARYLAQVTGQDFSLNLRLSETQPLLLQGNQGLSRKGPQIAQASYYYSKPQMAVQGHVVIKGQRLDVNPKAPQAAWLDHEWSQALLHPSAVGWDWIGMNLWDGSALTAFRLRDAAGGSVWAGGSFRSGANAGLAAPTIFQANEVTFTPLRHWTSPTSQSRYPVAWRIETPAGSFTVQAVIDDQELDSRASTGAIYWEGLSDLHNSQAKWVGKGYLEMTGYHAPLRLSALDSRVQWPGLWSVA
jgi:predicted secreted hydrolase